MKIYKISLILLSFIIKNFNLLGMEIPEKTSVDPVVCSICRSIDCEKDGNKMIMLPCYLTHVFHKSCLNSWLKINQTCPMCRAKFSSRLVNYLHEHTSQEIAKIQEIIGAVNLEMEKDLELKKAFLKEIEDFQKIMQNRPRSLREHLTEPKSSTDFVFSGISGCMCGSIWCTIYACSECCIFSRPEFIFTCGLLINSAILTFETMSYNNYDFDNIHNYWPRGVVMNFYHAVKSINQALREYIKERNNLVLHNHME